MRHIIFILLFSCSDQYVFNIESELSGYVQSFYDLSKKHGKNLDRSNLLVRTSIGIGANQGLSSQKNGQRIVEINYFSYQNYSSEYIEAIVFHELGHALLKRQHDDTIKSLMNATVCLSCYSNNKEYFIKELFK